MSDIGNLQTRRKNRLGERSVAIQFSNKIYVITGSPRSLYSLVKSFILDGFRCLYVYRIFLRILVLRTHKVMKKRFELGVEEVNATL